MTQLYDESAAADDGALCFAADTRILTTRGEVAVEQLAQDDLVVGMRRGKLAPVRGIGRREVDLQSHPDPDAMNPVRVCADAFGPGRPHRDLVLSPNHALYVDGQLIAVRHLLNGATIRQERRDSIVYYQVELDAHDILLANGMTAESYLDAGKRGAFAGQASEAAACAPALPTDEPLAGLRQALLERAAALGHATTADPDLRVMAGHRCLRPRPVAGGVRFQLPKNAARVRILSRAFVPHVIRAADPDCRRLGVGITSIRLNGRVVELDGDRLGEGWHPAEPGLRWTEGEAWLRTGIARSLDLTLLEDAIYWADEQTEVRPPAPNGALSQQVVARTPEENRLAPSATATGGAASGLRRVCASLISALTSLPFRTFYNV